MNLLKIGWAGTRTERPEAMAEFVEKVLGIRFIHRDGQLWAYQLPDGSKVEVFGPSEKEHFTTGPVVQFFTDDLEGATAELREAGVPIVSGPVYLQGEDAEAWVEFRAPDGNIYGITKGRDLLQPEAPR